MAMGLSNSFMSLGRIGGPLLAGFVFDINVVLPFISGAIVMLGGFFASLVWLKRDSSTKPIHESADQTTLS
jgi:DHA1 family multidrug resistance protein-like MFS transporter